MDLDWADAEATDSWHAQPPEPAPAPEEAGGPLENVMVAGADIGGIAVDAAAPDQAQVPQVLGNGGLRELHSGKAYPIELRHRVLNDVQFSSSAEVAAKYRISKRTVNRWRKRLATTDCAHRTPCHRPDPTILTPEVLEFIGWLLTLNPRFTNAALAEHVYEAFHVYLPHSTVSKALAHLRVTTKKAVKRAAQRNLEERVQWWTNPPFVSADQDRLLCRPGVAGLHASALVDVDETGIVVTDCIGQYARFFMGSRAEIDTLYPNLPGPRLTLVLAVDTRAGVVAWMLFEGSLDSDMWVQFMQAHLVPALQGTGPRVVMYDNCPSHNEEAALRCLASELHLGLRRPAYAHEFAPVENCFSIIKGRLDSTRAHITKANLYDYLAGAMAALTPELVESFFAHKHYFTDRHPFQPYLGE